MMKTKIMRGVIAIGALLSGIAFFFKYFSNPIGEFASAFIGDSMGLESLPGLLLSMGDALILLVFLCIVPIILLLLNIIFNIISLLLNKLERTSNAFTITSNIYTLLTAVLIGAVLASSEESLFGLSLTPTVGPMWWVQIISTIVGIALGIYLCVDRRRTYLQKNTVSPKDVALIGLRGNVNGQVFLLNDDEAVSIGRDPQQCNIIVPGSSANVSRKHCVIHYDFDRSAYMVMDTSSNGTFVYENGQKKRLPLGVEVPVAAGNVIMLGDELTTFRLN